MLDNIKVPARQPKSKKGYLAAREHWMKHVLADRNLSQRAKIAASTMSLYFNQEEFAKEGRLWAWPSLRTLDRATGQSKVTVIAAIEELKAAGYLEVRRRYDPVARRYKSHRYLAAIPEGDGSKPGKFSDPILNQGGSDGYTRVVQTGSTDSSTYSKNDSYAAGSLASADALRSPAEKAKKEIVKALGWHCFKQMPLSEIADLCKRWPVEEAELLEIKRIYPP